MHRLAYIFLIFKLNRRKIEREYKWGVHMNQISGHYNNYINHAETAKANGQKRYDSADFRQLLQAKIEMAMALNSQINQDADFIFPSFSASGSMFTPDLPFLMNNQVLASRSQIEPNFSAYNNDAINKTSVHSANGSIGKNDNASSSKINDIVRQAANRFNLDEKLIHAIIKTESNYNPKATSKAGAMGLMQLMPGTAREVGVTDPYDLAQNIYGGVQYFSNMLNKHKGNIELALASYNAGPGNVKKYGGIPPFKETKNYIRKVMNEYLGR